VNTKLWHKYTLFSVWGSILYTLYITCMAGLRGGSASQPPWAPTYNGH